MLVKPRLLTRGIRSRLPSGPVSSPRPALGPATTVRFPARALTLCVRSPLVRRPPCFSLPYRKWSLECVYWPVTAFMPMV